jgi:hypothetical protein
VKAFRRRLMAVAVALMSAGAVVTAGDRPQQSFVKTWQGRRVIVRRPLFSLVYNERGLLGNTHSGRRDGLTVVTPSEGTYLQFDGRQGRDDVVGRDPQSMVRAVAAAYEGDSLDVRQYRRVEPLLITRYDPGVELVVASVRLDRDTVKLGFVQESGPDGDDAPVTSLTIKWPVPLSKSFSERAIIEQLILPYVNVLPLR